VTAIRDPLLSCSKLGDADASSFPASAADAADGSELDVRRATVAGLYATHAPAVHRFLRDLLGDATLASDATQETFVRAFRRLASLQETGRAAPWLFGVARNVSLELRRARGRAGRVFAADGERSLESTAGPRHGSPESQLLGKETAGVLSAALARLSEDRRAALLLRLDHGLAYEDIAQLMGWSLPKVKVEIHRARETLRATLAEYEEGGAR
jgi:RNA polymerase sigma-70 factor (ECF subfamily)